MLLVGSQGHSCRSPLLRHGLRSSQVPSPALSSAGHHPAPGRAMRGLSGGRGAAWSRHSTVPPAYLAGRVGQGAPPPVLQKQVCPPFNMEMELSSVTGLPYASGGHRAVQSSSYTCPSSFGLRPPSFWVQTMLIRVQGTKRLRPGHNWAAQTSQAQNREP